MKLCFGGFFYNLFKWVYIEYIKMKKKKKDVQFLVCYNVQSFISFSHYQDVACEVCGNFIFWVWEGFIVEMRLLLWWRLYAQTCEFIVASVPVATINWNGRENSHCASQAIESCEEGEWSLSKLESPRQKKFPLLFAEEKELSLGLCLTAVFLCNSAVLILIK